MSDFERSGEREPVPIAVVVEQAERIMSRQRANTETLRKLWTDGDIARDVLPCVSTCDGEVVIQTPLGRLRGLCPAFELEGVCPIPSRAQRELEQRLKLAGFEKRYWDVDAERIRCRAAVEEYLAHLEENVAAGRGIILSGDVGTGKTMTLAYMARRMLVENYGVWCTNLPRLIDQLMSRDGRKPLVERLLSVQVLMVDDFGSGEMPLWVLGILEGIVERRYAALQPTLVSTNMTSDSLKSKVEFRRIVDRWRQCNRLFVVGGTSQRHD